MAPPVLDTPEAYVAVYRDPAYWRPYIDLALTQSNLPTVQTLEDPGEGTNVVFTVNGTMFVKLFTRFFNGDRQQGIERLALETIASYKDLKSPKLLASGQLFPNEPWPWDYVVMERVTAPTLNQIWPTMGAEERHTAARQVGEYLNHLHQVSVRPGLQRALPPKEWIREVEQRTLRHGFTTHLAEQAPEFVQHWLPEPQEVILHGDLNGEHILYANNAIAAVIDYGDLKIGHPVYDLAALHWDLFNADRSLLQRLLKGYGPMPDFSPQTALAFCLIHEWNVLKRQLESSEVRSARSLEHLAMLLWS